ncbi:MAG: CBS domain-containing protein [Caldilineaceae bacterium]
MTADLYYCFDDQPVSEAAGLMQRHQIRRLPIVNRDKELVGIVSLGDLAVDVDNQKLAGTTLETVSTPARPDRL